MSTGNPRGAPRPDLALIQETARKALTAPRTITPQVLQYLLSNFELTEGEVIGWLCGDMIELESYEKDLLFSPLFTPDFATRVDFEEFLGDQHLKTQEVDGLILDLVSSELSMCLVYEEECAEVPIADVLIERFVQLLHLDSPLPQAAVDDFSPLSPEVRCLLRDRSWKRPRSRKLLPTLLLAAKTSGGDFADCVRFLTEFLRSHRPASREDCRVYLENVAHAYEEDLEKYESGSRSFFSSELQATHSGKWGVKEGVVESHKRMSSMARRLVEALR